VSNVGSEISPLSSIIEYDNTNLIPLTDVFATHLCHEGVSPEYHEAVSMWDLL
jgi:hypothetical protein